MQPPSSPTQRAHQQERRRASRTGMQELQLLGFKTGAGEQQKQFGEPLGLVDDAERASGPQQPCSLRHNILE